MGYLSSFLYPLGLHTRFLGKTVYNKKVQVASGIFHSTGIQKVVLYKCTCNYYFYTMQTCLEYCQVYMYTCTTALSSVLIRCIFYGMV